MGSNLVDEVQNQAIQSLEVTINFYPEEGKIMIVLLFSQKVPTNGDN